jgi:hypothetical protein
MKQNDEAGWDVQEESPEEPVRNGLEELRAVDSSTSFDEMLEMYAERLPKHWDELTYSQKLEWFAHRMLLDAREDIRQREGNQAAKDWGFMSDYQIERRRRREVQSKLGGWDTVPPTAGNFHRVYVNPRDTMPRQAEEPAAEVKITEVEQDG